MKTSQGHLTYCTNIHTGEQWPDHFAELQKYIPAIKGKLSPGHPFGIGLRLSNMASLDLTHGHNLNALETWLAQTGCYVFTMNGFPYGGFHHTKVKDNVHVPDWLSAERLAYTVRLFHILARLLPAQMDGGISTSPLSYKHWHAASAPENIFQAATGNVLEVVKTLVEIKRTTGKSLHLDIEPEPDGLLESGPEFIQWYNGYLLPLGVQYLKKNFDFTASRAEDAIREHIQLCYDVCHFAVGYENHADILKQLKSHGIQTGKIQISAALKVDLPAIGEREHIREAFEAFNESTYLHQVVALQNNEQLKRYPDLPQALRDINDPSVKAWRSHFHVPLFVDRYGVLQSTQEDIIEVLSIQHAKPFTNHLEIETYTWEVLPEKLKMPLADSITREMQWVTDQLKHPQTSLS